MGTLDHERVGGTVGVGVKLVAKCHLGEGDAPRQEARNRGGGRATVTRGHVPPAEVERKNGGHAPKHVVKGSRLGSIPLRDTGHVSQRRSSLEHRGEVLNISGREAREGIESGQGRSSLKCRGKACHLRGVPVGDARDALKPKIILEDGCHAEADARVETLSVEGHEAGVILKPARKVVHLEVAARGSLSGDGRHAHGGNDGNVDVAGAGLSPGKRGVTHPQRRLGHVGSVGSKVSAVHANLEQPRSGTRLGVDPPRVSVGEEPAAQMVSVPVIGKLARGVSRCRSIAVRETASRIEPDPVTSRALEQPHAVGVAESDECIFEARVIHQDALAQDQPANSRTARKHVGPRIGVVHRPAVQVELGQKGIVVERAAEVSNARGVPAREIRERAEASRPVEDILDRSEVARVPSRDARNARESGVALEHGLHRSDGREVEDGPVKGLEQTVIIEPTLEIDGHDLAP